MTDKAELQRRLSTSNCRLLIVNDLHLRDKPPRSTTAAYLPDIFDILRFTVKLERGLGLDGVIWAGDIFDFKQPARSSHKLVLQAIEIVKSYRRLLILPGNHDISNDRLESIEEQQPLGVLYEAGAERLEGWVEDLPVFGVPWQQRWHEEGTIEEAFAGWRSAGRDLAAALAVTHASIYPPGDYEKQVFDVLHPSDFAAAMGHQGSLEYGHIHDHHGIYEVDGVSFANPGAISRGSLTEVNMQRGIHGVLWTPEHGFLELDLPHLPAEEIFLTEEVGARRLHELEDEKFLSEVGSTRLEISSISGVITHIQQREDVSDEVKQVAIEVLELYY